MSEKNCIVCNKPLTGQQKMYCSNTCKQKYYHALNKGNTYYHQTMRALKRKLTLIDYKGGQCEICGYNDNLAALEFHHIDPNLKKFPLDSKHLSNSKWEIIKEEADKCQLLCARCHREIHNPELSITDALDLIKDANKKSFNSKKSGRICPVCGNIFPSSTGKIYCSDKCRESIKFKNYPTIEEIEERYKELKNWEKVASSFNLTRKIIQGIRKRQK